MIMKKIESYSYLSSCLFIELLTKRGGLEAGCSVGLIGGGDRT
jgi:hypothetical protein